MNSHDPRLPEELAGTAELLRAARPELSSGERDRLRRRLRGRVPVRRAPSLVVALCLSLGFVFATAGTGLALSGLATSGPAVQAQYPDASGSPPAAQPQPQPGPSEPPAPPAPQGEVLGAGGEEESEPAPVTLGEDEPGAPAPAPAGDAVARQVQATGELPFTGYEAIPILLAGIALLAAGALLRRRGTTGAA